MPNQPSAELMKAIAQQRVAPSEDRLVALRNLVAYARDKEAEKSEVEEHLKALSAELNALYTKTLPDAMDEVGVGAIELPADGNHPPIRAAVAPFYAANIAASWDPERRADAFGWLMDHGHGDLIKTEITVSFPRGAVEEAQQLAASLREKGMTTVIKENIHPSTLSSWLKEQIEKHNSFPPLETIGGTVGRKVALKVKP